MQNTEQTVPSTEEHKTLYENIVIQYDNKQVRIHLYDTPLGKRFIEALKDNTVDDLRPQLALEAFQHTAEYDTAISKWMKNYGMG